jgi:hypothetical protein
MKDMTSELVQLFVSGAKASPKTVRNICVTLQSMWRSARAWGYVAHDLMSGVVWGILDANGRKKENGLGVEPPKPFVVN